MGLSLGLGFGVHKKDVLDTVFTPASLTGIMHWYKFDTDIYEDEDGGDAVEDEDNVYLWKDQIGSNDLESEDSFFLYESSTGSVVSSDGEDDKLRLKTQLNITGEFSLYIRYNATNTDSGGSTDLFFSDKDTPTTDFFRIQSGEEVRCKISGGSAIKWTQQTQSTNTFYNFGFERDSLDFVKAYRDGEILSNSTDNRNTNTLDLDAIGMNADGKIKEIIICNSSLSVSERANLETWLGALTQGE